MPRLVLPSGVATSSVEKHFQAGWFSRVLGSRWIPTEYTSYRGAGGSASRATKSWSVTKMSTVLAQSAGRKTTLPFGARCAFR